MIIDTIIQETLLCCNGCCLADNERICERDISRNLSCWSKIHLLISLLLSRETIICQRGESGHASSPGPNPAGTKQLINTDGINWRG